MKPTPPPGEVVWTEPRFRVRIHALPVRGGTQRRAFIEHPGAVVIVPVVPDGVVFIENRRWVVGQTLLELPAGGLAPGEDPAACALRELEEETGLRAGRLEPLQSFFALPAYTTEVMHAFAAYDLTPTAQRLEPDEQITVHPLRTAEIRARLAAGAFQDMKTLAVLSAWWARDPSGPCGGTSRNQSSFDHPEAD